MSSDPENLHLDVPFIPCSYLTTLENKTGSWRFLCPRYEEKTAPCGAACPAGEDIGRIQMLTVQGLFKEARDTILQENPFPAVCGRVCFHPCESVCNRREFDEAIAIHVIERFLADTAARNELQPALERLAPHAEKVAVLGAGPSGLAAAYFLARLGYGCDVFEAMPEPGGVLRWGIPPYRLPAAALAGEISRITALGVRIQCGKTVSRGFLEQARGDYQAIFVGCGHGAGRRLLIPGEERAVVVEGLEFLRALRQGETPALRGLVAVIGGGNTALDVARSVVRLGGKALLIYRRRRQDIPAFASEVAMALEEGIDLWELWAPETITAVGSDYLLTLRRMQVLEGDSPGPTRVTPHAHETREIKVQHIVKAVGAEPSEPWYNPPRGGDQVLALGNCLLARQSDDSAIVFGGDLAAVGRKSVVHAIASGKQAAMALDVLFREGLDAIQPRLADCAVGGGPALSMEIYLRGPRGKRSPHVVSYDEINSDYFAFAPRIIQPRLLREERLQSFAEIELKISVNLAMREAERCFNCGLCNQCDNCRLFCPDLAVVRADTPEGRRIDYDYCKGCGLCVVECPRNAMVLEEER